MPSPWCAGSTAMFVRYHGCLHLVKYETSIAHGLRVAILSVPTIDFPRRATRVFPPWRISHATPRSLAKPDQCPAPNRSVRSSEAFTRTATMPATSSGVATSMRMRGVRARASITGETSWRICRHQARRGSGFLLRAPPADPSFFQPRSHEVSLRLTRLLLFCFIPGVASVASAQLPLAPTAKSGHSVTPVFEGWYRNPDGTFSLSFGYYNRNASEVIEIPTGADNFIAPGDSNQGQPTRFEARRHWGVFAVKVPANFGTTNKVTWTLKMRGETLAIPGSLHVDWEIDALAGEAGTGNTPPVIKLSAAGPEARGPGGAMSAPIPATVGQPVTITIWATDDGRGDGSVAGGRSEERRVGTESRCGRLLEDEVE